MQKYKKKTKRTRRKKETCYFNSNKIQKAIKIEKIKKEGLGETQIECFLANAPNFLGCFPQDRLKDISIRSLPVFLIVNFDHSYSSGTHWIAIRISKRRVEIFDPLGFNVSRWPNVPYHLLDFLNKFSLHRSIRISKEIQPINSTLCGFYSMFFVYFRNRNTFSYCNNVFSSKLKSNDRILYNMFNKV